MRVGPGKPTVTMVIQMDEVGIQQLYVFSWKDVGPIEDLCVSYRVGKSSTGSRFRNAFCGKKNLLLCFLNTFVM